MPVILEKDYEKEWLSELDIKDVLRLLTAYNERNMKAHEVSPLVNSPANNSPEVLEPV